MPNAFQFLEEQRSERGQKPASQHIGESGEICASYQQQQADGAMLRASGLLVSEIYEGREATAGGLDYLEV